MARNVEHVEGIVDWIHPLDRIIKDAKKPKEWTCEEDALSFDLKVLTGVDFMRLERVRGQLAQEDVNVMARVQAITRDIVETYVDNPRHYSVPISAEGRKQAAELFRLSFPADQTRYRPKNGKELWIACAICPGMEYQEVLDPIVKALQHASMLSEGARKKSPLQPGSDSAETKTSGGGAAPSADAPKREALTPGRNSAESSGTAIALQMRS